MNKILFLLLMYGISSAGQIVSGSDFRSSIRYASTIFSGEILEKAESRKRHRKNETRVTLTFKIKALELTCGNGTAIPDTVVLEYTYDEPDIEVEYDGSVWLWSPIVNYCTLASDIKIGEICIFFLIGRPENKNLHWIERIEKLKTILTVLSETKNKACFPELNDFIKEMKDQK